MDELIELFENYRSMCERIVAADEKYLDLLKYPVTYNPDLNSSYFLEKAIEYNNELLRYKNMGSYIWEDAKPVNDKIIQILKGIGIKENVKVPIKMGKSSYSHEMKVWYNNNGEIEYHY